MSVFENVFTAAAHGGGLEHEAAYGKAIESLALTGMTAIANRRAETLGLIDRKRLELARALTDYGAALRRSGRRGGARTQLERGLDLAHHLGAQRIANQARGELIAAGAKPRPALFG